MPKQGHQHRHDADPKEHVELHTRDKPFHAGHASERGACNHDNQQSQCQPFFPARRDRRVLRSVAQHQEDARFAPCLDERSVGVEHQRVARPEECRIGVEHLAVASYGAYFGPVVALEVKFCGCAVDSREPRSQYGFDRVGGFAGLFFALHRAVGEAFVAAQDQVEHSDDGDAESDLAQFKHGESLEAGVEHHAVHDQVGRCADQRAHAAQYGGIGERDEKLAHGKARFAGPLLDDRDEDHDNGRVVQECRYGGDRRQDAQVAFAYVRTGVGRQQPFDQMPQRVASPHPFTDQEQQPYGDYPLVCESGQRLPR